MRTPRGVAVAGAAVRIEVSRSGGPGGQHVNTSSTKVTVVLDVVRGLDRAVAEKVLARRGPTMRVTSSTHRSQARNRAEAIERLLDRIDESLEVQPERAPTRVPTRERRRRRDAKQRRSQKLEERRPDTNW